MAAPLTTLPAHVLVSSAPFPTTRSTFSHPNLLSPASITYHFASDPTYVPPLNPSPVGGERVLVWDGHTGQTTSLGSECVGRGVSKHGEGADEVWVVDVQEGPTNELAQGDQDRSVQETDIDTRCDSTWQLTHSCIMSTVPPSRSF